MVNTLKAYTGKTVAVLGLAISGLPCATILEKSGAIVKAWDDSEEKRKFAADKGVHIVSLYEEDFSLIDSLVASPGIPDTHPVIVRAKLANCPIVGEVKLLWDSERSVTYIGITGTNGKSTTSALIYHILVCAGREAALGGNTELPSVSLPTFETGSGIYVLEMSSFMLERIPGVKFDVGVFTNLSEDHLDVHKTMENYYLAKKHLFDNMTKHDNAVVCVDSKFGQRLANEIQHTKITTVSSDDETKVYPQLDGCHNKENIICARNVAKILGISDEDIEKGLETFVGLKHRQQTVRSVKNVKFVNDSKGTNAHSTMYALLRFSNMYWIVGGREKHGGYGSLCPYLHKVRQAFVIGEGATNIMKFLDDNNVSYVLCNTLDVAVIKAGQQAIRDTEDGVCSSATVLLSPACSSFDQFRNFEQRGDVFEQLVNELQLF